MQDAPAVTIVLHQILSRHTVAGFVALRIVCGRRIRMTTEYMEVYSLEIGDQISCQGAVYRIVGIEDGDSSDYRLVLVDEEGYRRSIEVMSDAKLRVIIDEYV